MEIVYRIGADIGQRDQVERDLSSDLGSYPEVWCAWSDPGDDHAVIISYTGVIRQDLTVDPEDPRFQAFSVGFGTDFDAAEMHATTINQRFSSQSDGSGYEVLLRETRTVAEGSVAEGAAAVSGQPGFSPPDGPICTGRASSEGCWAEIGNHPGCYLWNPGPREGFSANWSGECSGGFVEGRGEVTWRWNDGSATDSGLFQGGKREGFHVVNWSNGERYEGSYVNDERQGTWTLIWEDGTRDVGPYVNGQRHGNWTESYADGSRGEGPYVNGERHGTWTESSEDGRDRQVGPYVNGERHGTWTFNWGEGDVGREVGPYVNGERHGVWTGYDQSGNRLGTIRYENGRRVGGSGSTLQAGTVATLTPPQLACPAAQSSTKASAVTPRYQRTGEERQRRDGEDRRSHNFPFAVGLYGVPFDEWEACARAGGCGGAIPDDEGWGRGRRPVINVNWEEAQAYVRCLLQETGHEYRLLSEAEWEYVARAGTGTARYWGETPAEQRQFGSGTDALALANSPEWGQVECSDGYAETAPVGSYQPNGFGLHDVLANVCEWTRDCPINPRPYTTLNRPCRPRLTSCLQGPQ